MTFTEAQSKIDTLLAEIEIYDSWGERVLPEYVEQFVYRLCPEAEYARNDAILLGRVDEFWKTMCEAIEKFKAHLFRMKLEKKLVSLRADQVEMDLLAVGA